MEATTLSREDIDKMSPADMKRYFTSQAYFLDQDDAKKAVEDTERVADMSGKTSSFIKGGIVAIGSALGAIAFPPLVLVTVLSAGHSVCLAKQLDIGETPASAVNTTKNQNKELKETMARQLLDGFVPGAKRYESLQKRLNLQKKMQSIDPDMKLDQVFKEKGGWVLDV